MTIKLGIVMDPIATINPTKDSSLAMLWAAQDLGWQLYYMEQRHLFNHQGVAKGLMQPLRVKHCLDDYYHLGTTINQPLAELDVILMRKDPPFDSAFLHTTYLLEQAERAGTLIVNRPQSLRDCNEKIFATWFPQCCPPVLVAQEPALLKQFYQQQQDVIFKPLDGMGGASIFRVQPADPNLNVILETLTDHGRRQIMAQRYIPAISQGDKRILLIDGKPVNHALARIPSSGESRGNLAAGGKGVAQPLSQHDRWICQQVGPTLQERGLHFVGLDVIGDYLTEINVTSPTCIREIDDQTGSNIGAQLLAHLHNQLQP